MKRRIICWILVSMFCLLTIGCQESESQSHRRAQLVGNENIKLKKQLQNKDREIERLQDTIKKIKEEAQKDAEKQSQTASNLSNMIVDLNKELEACKAQYMEK